MVSSSNLMPSDAANPQGYFAGLRALVNGFAAQHFTWPGTFRLHRVAFGWDVLRAPLNVLLGPVFLLTRLISYLCLRLRLRRVGGWLARRRILLRTAVAARVETLIVTDLLGLPLDAGDRARDPSALARAVLAAPQFREMIRKRSDPAAADASGQRIARALADYASTRSAVAEMTTALCTIAVGASLFNALTPGMISLAPGVADALARSTAIAAFPLGETLGGMWYGMFRPGASPVLIGLTVAALIIVGSVFAAFAGIIADPVQSRLGIHRRRLLRLIDTLEVELQGSGHKAFATREHIYARALDIWDAAASLLRIFRS
ncbi:hypothetical protein JQX09_21160 [Sulfitobacter pseudonitzschiae]|uniref:Uncharacterized protein n=1 Tax=Pseudosulfitobacter pseudonitzschiae TaxID=1402135 RepID=A0A9Q2NM41_9RHOB|nr:DUF6635 family protein [Pseudosulfitobacter pseudonitzschiae]MBM2294438.1 hypothetical protein [Pseudosulfitobacter pseudonitzschiae]MBM2299406.1 hypothetical protein [Pseudosulfitobacter pseudonitzschiae]MBM2304270.1 hypothetical protein [Pseudosulfitobacter pseudonitzschiae]MBM2314050.1 hypothetical protein [Pseudosulfitobacter pseudonitzschiae]MBM2318965.1 hypothetical protein [Pseudosulfitobacter pseudonitzschiae]